MSKPVWTLPAELRAELDKRWQRGQILTESLASSGLFPLRIPLKSPSPAQLAADFTAVQVWVEPWLAVDAKHFAVEWRDINHRLSGRNRLPAAVVFDKPDDAAAYLKKAKELVVFGQLAASLAGEFTALRSWLLKYPLRALEHAEEWQKLLSVAGWVVKHPRPGIYLRQISLPGIDSKFIESRKKLLGEWLDLLLPAAAIDTAQTGVTGFEARYGFLAKPATIRFRLLDSRLHIAGLSDLTVTAGEFATLNLQVKRVFVTENDINGLAFPPFADSMVIFGRGYGFDALAQAEWLKDKEIHYWGDIDTHGFAILSQFRQYFPRTHSLLMDQATLLAHRESWVAETTPGRADLSGLTFEETALYDALRDNRFGQNLRLEQEYVGFAALGALLARLQAEA
ncbi:Wadjet anti-phage system protein JetD domain-containing protein [Methylomonas sp. CM2]|uniref:Wadjet anti-phage system protein JetD domain-containing protein n=1 Tax=Methylomonas sp. CM2 TaxID=3417647 RepID=UPI003CE7CE89